MSERVRLGRMLVEKGAVTGSERDSALGMQREGDSRRIGEILVRLGSTSEESVARSLAQQLNIRYLDPTTEPVDPVVVWKIKRERAENLSVLPMSRLDNGSILVAMSDPRNMDAIRDLEFLFHTSVTPASVSPSRLHQAIHRHYSMEHEAQALLRGIDPKLAGPTTSPTGLELDVDAIQRRLKEGGSAPYADLFNFLLINAIQRKASDIHMEPQHNGLWVRYRIDGLLREVLRLPTWTERPLSTRVKVVGQLSIFGNKAPQDGKVSANLGGRHIDLRISVIPSQYGEKIVIRLLDPTILNTDLGELGWQPQALREYYRLVSQPQGLVICVGPTGSGKSTTLYGTIQRLRGEETSIVTVEDPIEYSLPGITQVQVGKKGGMHFETAIRSLLRQDPNVIVIGEIRDKATAEAALEAANTGHLVLSTVHANHAVSTITRLLDLGVPPYLLSATLTGVVAQRLVRQVCQECGIQGTPEPEDWIRLGIHPPNVSGNYRRVGPGCPTCRYEGYSGRVGVYEVLSISNDMRELIASSAGEPKLWAQSRRDGMMSMLTDALEKARVGMTTLEEVARIVPIEPWRKDEARTKPRTRKAPTQPLPDLLPISNLPEDNLMEVFEDDMLVELDGSDLMLQPEDLLLPPIDSSSADLPQPKHLAQQTAPQAATSAQNAVSTPPRRARPMVLIADDADEIRGLIAATLEDDYDIILAKDGSQALQMAKDNVPDILVLDVMMPGLTGFDVCARLREIDALKKLPVLFLSARGERSYIKKGFKVGADDYLSKPFDPEELQLRLQALLRRSR